MPDFLSRMIKFIIKITFKNHPISYIIIFDKLKLNS